MLKEYIRDGFDPKTYPDELLATLCNSCHTYSDRRNGILKIPCKDPAAEHKRMKRRHQLSMYHSNQLGKMQDAIDKALFSKGYNSHRRHSITSNLPSELPNPNDLDELKRLNDWLKMFLLELLMKSRKERIRLKRFRLDGGLRDPHEELNPVESSGVPENCRVPFEKLTKMIIDEYVSLDFEIWCLEEGLNKTSNPEVDQGLVG
ncbi:MAG: hypothetical protein ACW992_02545 [Candidatus Thorarchaeota archaeon]|jgi:hypothetical protein